MRYAGSVISADRNCLYDKGPGGVGQKNLVSFSRAGSCSGHSVGGGIRSICGRNGARDVRIPIPAGCGGGLEPLWGSCTEFSSHPVPPCFILVVPRPQQGKGPVTTGAPGALLVSPLVHL